MLVQLNISNFAIIKHLEITFRPGLNILSGETGAGKSIIINAMNLILGGRASTDLIRSGCEEARVEALFTFPESPVLKKLLAEVEVSTDGELLIKRAIYREGRNRISINGSMATVQMLSRLGPMLISISGQHAHQLLLKPENHLYLLDDFGMLGDRRAKFGALFEKYQFLKGEIQALENKISKTKERQELARFQIQEIERAGVMPGEDEVLIEERKRLQYAEDLLKIMSEAYQKLYERNDSAISLISQCGKEIDRGASLDARLSSVRKALEEAEFRLEDVALTLRDFEKDIHLDPRKLEEVEERLQVLNTLKRKYGPTLTDVVNFKDEVKRTMNRLDEGERKLSQLGKERKELRDGLMTMAQDLSRRRKDVAKKLERAVEKELHRLNMTRTRFKVSFHESDPQIPAGEVGRSEAIRADGLDHVEFMISPNVGEPLRALVRIASGGELSRVMLALKTILARTASVETIIFDEVDSGIGGATAEVVGEKLLSLAEYHQVLCITHLPQIASKGSTHFKVRKEVIEGRTQTLMSELDSEARVLEVARLLGGKEITERAVAHAVEMLS